MNTSLYILINAYFNSKLNSIRNLTINFYITLLFKHIQLFIILENDNEVIVGFIKLF